MFTSLAIHFYYNLTVCHTLEKNVYKVMPDLTTLEASCSHELGRYSALVSHGLLFSLPYQVASVWREN